MEMKNLQNMNSRNSAKEDFNRWTLNDVLAVNPTVRFLTALLLQVEGQRPVQALLSRQQLLESNKVR